MAYTRHRFMSSPYRETGAGIYAIINKTSGKLYIGSSIHLNRRWNQHRHELDSGTHSSRYMLKAYKKDPAAFDIQVIETLPHATARQLVEREQFWMLFYRSCNPAHGYNLSPTASSCAGTKHPPEYGAAISARQKGVKWSEERKARTRLSRVTPRGWRWTEEQKARHSVVHKGQKWTDSQRVKFKSWMKDHPDHSKKPVIQLSLDGLEVGRFNSVSEAENKFGKRSNIHSVCKGKRNECFGFIWKYA